MKQEALALPFQRGDRQYTSVDPRWKKKNVYNDCRPITITGIQTKCKELTKTFMIITNWKRTSFSLHGLYEKNLAL